MLAGASWRRTRLRLWSGGVGGRAGHAGSASRRPGAGVGAGHAGSAARGAGTRDQRLGGRVRGISGSGARASGSGRVLGWRLDTWLPGECG
jgi:hypothetical protein